MIRLIKFFLALVGLTYLFGGIYTLHRIWFGDWKNFKNTPSYDMWNWWIVYLSNHWLIISTVALTVIIAIGILYLVMLYTWRKG